jgi:hypothetical protein
VRDLRPDVWRAQYGAVTIPAPPRLATATVIGHVQPCVLAHGVHRTRRRDPRDLTGIFSTRSTRSMSGQPDIKRVEGVTS